MDLSDKPKLPSLCRRCNKVKNKIHTKTFKDGSKYFVDESGKKWLGQVCPSCVPLLRSGYYDGVEHKKATCQICSKEFEQKNSIQVYCSIPCSKQATLNRHRVSKASKVGEE